MRVFDARFIKEYALGGVERSEWVTNVLIGVVADKYRTDFLVVRRATVKSCTTKRLRLGVHYKFPKETRAKVSSSLQNRKARW